MWASNSARRRLEPPDRARLRATSLDRRGECLYESADDLPVVSWERAGRDEHETVMRRLLLAPPSCLDLNEVRNVLGDQTPLVELRRDEDLWIWETAHRRLLLDRHSIDAPPSQSFGHRWRKHLVEQQPHP